MTSLQHGTQQRHPTLLLLRQPRCLCALLAGRRYWPALHRGGKCGAACRARSAAACRRASQTSLSTSLSKPTPSLPPSPLPPPSPGARHKTLLPPCSPKWVAGRFWVGRSCPSPCSGFARTLTLIEPAVCECQPFGDSSSRRAQPYAVWCHLNAPRCQTSADLRPSASSLCLASFLVASQPGLRPRFSARSWNVRTRCCAPGDA